MSIPRLLFPVVLSVAGFAQTGGQVNVWIPRGPEGGIVGPPASDPQNLGTLYVGASGKLFKTTDAAGHWIGLGFPSVTVLAVDPQTSGTLYGASNNVLFKSTDGGLTWNASGTGVPCPCTNLASLVIDPSNPNTLYVAYSGTSGDINGGLFKSTDGGATWRAASSGLPVYQPAGFRPYSAVIALVMDPQNPSTLYAAPGLNVAVGGGVYKSTDGAASWSPANSGIADSVSVGSLAIDPQNPNTLYVGTQAGPSLPLLKSTDGASSWTAASTGFPALSLAVDPQESGTLYAVSYRGVVKSADGGASWSVVLSEVTLNSSASPWLIVRPSAGGASTVYVGGTGRGVFKSSDGGLTWSAANSGLIATSIDSLAIDPQNPRTVYAGSYFTGLFKSSDGAETWNVAPGLTALGVLALALDPQNSGVLYASFGRGLHKSVDGGQSWVQLPLDANYESFWGIALDSQNAHTVYAGGFKSTDGGANWAKLSGFAGISTALAVDPQNSGTIFIGTMTDSSYVTSIASGALKSVDGGKSWTPANTLWQYVMVSSVEVDPSNSAVVYAQTSTLECDYYVCTNDYYSNPDVLKNIGVYRSADGGATWAKLNMPGGSPYVTLLGVDSQGTVYLRAQRGLFRSQDGGATWKELPRSGVLASVTALAFDPKDANHLFAATYGEGVFEITLAQQD